MMTTGSFSQHQRAFVKYLTEHSSEGYFEAPYRRFERWCEAAYCALARAVAVALADGEQADTLEARYLRVAGTVGPFQMRRFAEMTALLVTGLEESDSADFLSAVVQSDDVRATNSHLGQFFTPFELCRLMSALTIGSLESQLSAQLVSHRTSRAQALEACCSPSVSSFANRGSIRRRVSGSRRQTSLRCAFK